jgi:hypothetical protein
MNPLDRVSRTTWLRVGGVLGATLVLTASFLGVLAAVVGVATGVGNRLSLYFLAGGVAFVVTTLALSRRGLDGATVLLATTGASVLTFLLTLSAGEGVRYAVLRPGEVFDVRLLGYLAAAGLVVTGLSIWTVRYWREFLGDPAT